jgi:hypothetical protein
LRLNCSGRSRNTSGNRESNNRPSGTPYFHSCKDAPKRRGSPSLLTVDKATKLSSIKWHDSQRSLTTIQPDCDRVNDIGFIDENVTAGGGTTKPEATTCRNSHSYNVCDPRDILGRSRSIHSHPRLILSHFFERTPHGVKRRERSRKVESWDVLRSSRNGKGALIAGRH